VYVDSGFMRQGETEEIKGLLNESDVEVQVYDGKDSLPERPPLLMGRDRTII